MTGASVSESVLRLVRQIEEFCAEPARDTGPEAAADLRELSRGRCMLDLKFSEMAAAFAATDPYDADGSLSPIHWLRLNCHMTSGAAGDRLAVGEQVASVPQSIEAMAGGDIGFSHLALIAREAIALQESGSKRPFDETPLLYKAMDFTVGRFRNYCHHYRHSVDPEGYAKQEAETSQARALSLTTGEGGVLWIRGVLDAEGGATLRTALEPLAKRNAKGDDRRLDRRLADGLVEMAHHALDGGALAQRVGQRPHLQVTTTLETLLQRCGAPAADLELSVPISARAVERLACDCNVTRMLLNADSQVIDVGRTTRKIRGSTRRALNVRDKGCRWPGCDRAASYTSGHHLKHWIAGGSTDLSNLVLLCHRHHWMVHEGRWQIVRTEGGQYVTVPPRMDLFRQLPRGPDSGVA
ncbi:MAG: DUF222 domain-containing protein [Chloroflexi bacterium]|nr:MAG: DUF222 domain-containing protein [Chloroflexota bacterium]